MSFAWQSFDVVTICALGIGGTVLGLIGLIFGSILRDRSAAIATGILVVGWAVGLPVALALHVEPVWWLPPLALLTLTRGLAALRTPWFERLNFALLRLMRPPRVQAGALLLAGPLCMALYAERLDSQFAFKEEDFSKFLNGTANLEEEPTRWALTDAGRSVPLFITAQSELDTSRRSPDDMAFIQKNHLQMSVIRDKPATDLSNCHGWVFTGGQYWIRGGSVDTILQDNGYRPISSAQIGDLAIYRDPDGAVIHSGIVCGFTRASDVLIESKWGRLGCYIHRAGEGAYSDTTCTYYHSPRTGHLLNDFATPARGAAPKTVE